MTDKERKLALYCMKASSDYHSEVCEECINYPNCDHMGQDDVTETIIRALEQEPCEDTISRQAVISTIYDNKSDFKNDFAQGFFADRIRDLPPVTPQPKTGHWIKLSVGYGCSECTLATNDYGKNMYRYCPNCGAKMEG